MNSQEQRFLNAMHDHGGEDPFEVGERLDYNRGQVNYYLSKWLKKGWYDVDVDQLTDMAPPRTETMRQQLERRGWDPKNRSRPVSAEAGVPQTHQGAPPTPHWALIVTPDYQGFIEFLERGHAGGRSYLHAKKTAQVSECLEKFDRHMPVCLGPRWEETDVTMGWLAAKGISPEVLT